MPNPTETKTNDDYGPGVVRRQTTTRRPRVALACQRCKTRKQKCDGLRPICSNCNSFNAECKYIKPTRYRPRSQDDESAAAAEARVAELESILMREGITDEGQERWRQRQAASHSPTGSEPAEMRVPAKRAHEESPCPEPDRNDGNAGAGIRRTESTSVLEILRDLSLEATGGYIGASSSITMSKMVSSIVKCREPNEHDTRQEEHLSPRSLSDSGLENNASVETGNIPQDIADKLLKGYLKHISTRWPILHSVYIRSLHARRSALTDSYERCALHLVYASGGRFLETAGEPGAFHCERHHAAAMKYADELFSCHDVRSVQILILLAIYSLRAPQGPGAWTYIGLAMRACINLGMHRKTAARGCSMPDSEMNKRIFWTAYSLDRQISIILGRPFAISDRDIDAELPLDVNESVQDSATLMAAQKASRALDPNPESASTSLSCFIHICRLRRIESAIQQSIYRVDQQSGVSEIEILAFVRQLEKWKEGIPCDARQHGADKPTTRTDTLVIDGYGYYMVYYYKCLRFLLHPLLSVPETSIDLIKKCAEACGGVCETYKKLHQNISVGFSLMALHSVFLAGLTILYCTWISPNELFNITNSNAMNACSIVLYIITERWPGAKKYRDMYESVKQSVLESIEESKYEPRHAIKRLNPSLFNSMSRNEEGREEVTRMVADMAGLPVFSDDMIDFTNPGSMTFTPSFPQDVPIQLQATTLEFPQQSIFDPSLSSFQDFSFAQDFDLAEFDAGSTNFNVDF